MPRNNEMVGEATQLRKAAARTAAAPRGFGPDRLTAESAAKTTAPNQGRWQRSCCKTCKGKSCTGHCKF